LAQNNTVEDPIHAETDCGCMSRRTVVSGIAGLGVLMLTGAEALAQDAGGPAPGDILVNAKGEAPLTPADITGDSKQILFAYAQDAAGVTKKGGKNKIALVRLDPSKLGEEALPRSADGVMAFSGLCTHAGCDVKAFDPDKGLMKCPCHGSVFDPAKNGEVATGPAKHRLASLVIEIENDRFVVKEGFDGKVGAQP